MTQDFSSAIGEILHHLRIRNDDRVVVQTVSGAKHRGVLEGNTTNIDALVLSGPNAVIPWTSVDSVKKETPAKVH